MLCGKGWGLKVNTYFWSQNNGELIGWSHPTIPNELCYSIPIKLGASIWHGWNNLEQFAIGTRTHFQMVTTKSPNAFCDLCYELMAS
jgi:hypothetical protein